MNLYSTIQRPRGILLDLDGTVYRGDHLIPGAAEAIEWLRARNHPVVLVTNAIETRAEHVDKLARLGVSATLEQIINSPFVLIRHLGRELPAAVVFPIGDPPLIEQLAPHFRLSDSPDEIDVVVASTDRAFDYRKLNIAFQALRRGARFWATNADPTWPLADGEIPDVGAIIGALEQLDRTAGECIVVGDSLASDIAMGSRAGMTTVLVLTGARAQPDYVLESIADLPQVTQSGL